MRGEPAWPWVPGELQELELLLLTPCPPFTALAMGAGGAAEAWSCSSSRASSAVLAMGAGGAGGAAPHPVPPSWCPGRLWRNWRSCSSSRASFAALALGAGNWRCCSLPRVPPLLLCPALGEMEVLLLTPCHPPDALAMGAGGAAGAAPHPVHPLLPCPALGELEMLLLPHGTLLLPCPALGEMEMLLLAPCHPSAALPGSGAGARLREQLCPRTRLCDSPRASPAPPAPREGQRGSLRQALPTRAPRAHPKCFFSQMQGWEGALWLAQTLLHPRRDVLRRIPARRECGGDSRTAIPRDLLAAVCRSCFSWHPAT